MGRIIFFLILVFCAILAFRIVAKLRKGSGNSDENSKENSDGASDNIAAATKKSAETEAQTTAPALALAPCPLCALHLPAGEVAAHLKQAHGAA